jgi:uncharacterized protein (TIGR02246 family)
MKLAACLALSLLAAGSLGVRANMENPISPAADPTAPRIQTNDEAGVRAEIAAYVAAFNRGDANAIAELWSPEGVYETPDGEVVKGRAAILKTMTESMKESKGTTLDVGTPSIRFVTADVAVEEGTAKMVRSGLAIDEVKYLAMHVRKDGKWMLDSIRETAPAPSPANHDKLGQLAWMVGEWTASGDDTTVEMKVDWAKNNTFLRSSFRVTVGGSVEQEGTQVIGWDPAKGTIRSWVFDSDGGFGESVWTPKNNSWQIKANGTLPDGRTADATHYLTRKDDGSYTWKSTGRRLGGEFQQNVPDVTFVRKAAEAGAAQEGAAK